MSIRKGITRGEGKLWTRKSKHWNKRKVTRTNFQVRRRGKSRREMERERKMREETRRQSKRNGKLKKEDKRGKRKERNAMK